MIRLQSWRCATLLKRNFKYWRAKYCEIFKNIIFTEHLQQMFSQENNCGGGLIWINFLQRVMRYYLFVGYDISRITDTYKKSFICILLKHGYIPHINNLFLIPDLFARRMMTCLCRPYWLHDVLWCLPYKVNYDVLSREAWVDS